MYHERRLPNLAVSEDGNLQKHRVRIGLRVSSGGRLRHRRVVSTTATGSTTISVFVGKLLERRARGGPREPLVGPGLSGAGKDIIPEVTNYPAKEVDLADDAQPPGMGPGDRDPPTHLRHGRSRETGKEVGGT